MFGLSIIKHVTLQKVVAHEFRYDPRISDCSGYTSLSENTDTITTHHKICTGVLLKSKDKTKLPPQPKVLSPLTVYRQIIRGLKGKVNELVSQLYPTLPHILCLTENHMKHSELQRTFLININWETTIVERLMKWEECAYMCKKV